MVLTLNRDTCVLCGKETNVLNLDKDKVCRGCLYDSNSYNLTHPEHAEVNLKGRSEVNVIEKIETISIHERIKHKNGRT